MSRWLLAFAGTFLLLFAFAHGNIENTDVTATMHASRALWQRGDSGLRGSAQGPEWPGEAVVAEYVRAKAAEGRPTYGKDGANGLVYVWFPIGHLWTLVPAVAGGEALARVFPDPERRFRERAAPGLEGAAAVFASQDYRDGHFVWDQALCAGLPALFGAAAVLLLLAIARALGAAPRDALLSTLAIAVGTQFFPLTRENLSDGPGLCFLLGALLAVAHALRGTATPRTLVLGGAAAGLAVLSRYQHGTLVPFLALAIAFAGRARGRLVKDLAWFALGGAPWLALLLLTNWLRFHDVTDTGYPKAGSWFNYPIWFGALKILIGAGKGILWFTPLLWLVVPRALRARPAHGWLAWLLFAVPFLMFSATSGWQSGQCWGNRYVGPGIVAFFAIALPQLLPWRTHRRLFWALFALGVFVNVTGVVTPTRGYCQLAGQAVQAHYQAEHEAGRIADGDWASVQDDAADHYFFEPRYSPLHANWTYLWRSLTGGFEDADGRRRDGSANTIEPLFGERALTESQAHAPLYWEDRACRHLWWRFWGDLYGVPGSLLVLPVLLLGALLARRGFRALAAG